MWSFGPFEPPPAAAQQRAVIAAIREGEQVLDRTPHRHVDEDTIVVVGAKRSGVARIARQTPDESRAPVRQRVDLVEPGDEVRHLRVVEVVEHAADVVLGEVVWLGHDGALGEGHWFRVTDRLASALG